MVLIPTVPTEAKTKTTTVTIKSDKDIDKAVKTVHKNAMKHKKMELKISGSKTKAFKRLEKFEKQLQLYNTYSVCIKVSEKKKTKKYTIYSISKENTLTYDYAIQYIQKCINKRDIKWKEVCDRYSEMYQIEPNIIDYPEYMGVYQMAQGKTFAQLSTFMQRQFLYLAYKYNVKERDYARGTDSKRLKVLINGTGKGACHEYALYMDTLLKQLNIPSIYQSDKILNHAWLSVYVIDDNGSNVWTRYDSGSTFPAIDATTALELEPYGANVPKAKNSNNLKALKLTKQNTHRYLYN